MLADLLSLRNRLCSLLSFAGLQDCVIILPAGLPQYTLEKRPVDHILRQVEQEPQRASLGANLPLASAWVGVSCQPWLPGCFFSVGHLPPAETPWLMDKMDKRKRLLLYEDTVASQEP